MSSTISQSDAHQMILRWMQKEHRDVGNGYGYDIYLPVMISYQLGSPQFGELERYQRANMAAFLGAAWELCRRGILRPSVRDHGGQGTSDGYGYSITPVGEAWLVEAAKDQFVAMEPGQIAKMLGAHRVRFGDGFHERAQEAARAYSANVYLACCAMCGAAAESILLAAAFGKGDKDTILKDFKSRGGRGRVQTLVFGSVDSRIQDQAAARLELLKYWRDDASHGEFCGITEAEAFTALLLLVRFAILVDEHWAELIAKRS